MICKNCETELKDGIKFCPQCGTKIEIVPSICPSCNTELEKGVRFCPGCGTKINSETSTRTHAKTITQDKAEEQSAGLPNNYNKTDAAPEKIILGDDFIVQFFKTYHEKLNKRLDQANDCTDEHEQILAFNGTAIKYDYTTSVEDCFDYFIASARNGLTKEDISRIKTHRDNFLSDESARLYESLTQLDEKTRTLNNLYQTSTEGLLKGFKEGLSNASLGGLGALKSLASSVIDGKKEVNNVQTAYSEWQTTKGISFNEIDRLYNKLTSVINDIANDTEVEFAISEDLELSMEIFKSPFENIIAECLDKEGSCFLFYGAIPSRKRVGAKKSYVSLSDDERIVCLYDSTLLGSGKEGICLTNKAIYWNDSSGDSKGSCLYTDLGLIDIIEDDKENEIPAVYVNLKYTGYCPMYKELEDVLWVIYFRVQLERLKSVDLPMRDDAETIWQNEFGSQEEGEDYTGSSLSKEDYCNKDSLDSWCVEKIAQNGHDNIENLQIVSCLTYLNRGCKDEFTIDNIFYKVIKIEEKDALEEDFEICSYPYAEKGKKYCIVEK